MGSQQHDLVWHSLTCFFSRGLQCARSVLVQSEGTQLLCHSHGRHLHISFHLQRSNPLPVHLHGLAYPWCATAVDSSGVVVTNGWGDCEVSATSACQTESI